MPLPPSLSSPNPYLDSHPLRNTDAHGRQTEQLNSLVKQVVEVMDGVGQLGVVQTVCDALPPSVQVKVTADLLTGFAESQLRKLVQEMSEDNEGSDALDKLKRTTTRQTRASIPVTP